MCVTSFVDGPSLVWSAESEVGEAEVDRRRREDQRRPVEEHRRHLKKDNYSVFHGSTILPEKYSVTKLTVQ